MLNADLRYRKSLIGAVLRTHTGAPPGKDPQARADDWHCDAVDEAAREVPPAANTGNKISHRPTVRPALRARAIPA